MMSKNMISMNKALVALAIVALLSGCGRSVTNGPGEASNLETWSKEIEGKKGPNLDPLPVLTKFEPVSYNAEESRDPFSPAAMRDEAANSLRPNANRAKEILEGFALDGLVMVGTMGEGNGLTGLIRAPDSVVYRVRVGEYMGQNDGRIVSVSNERIVLMEVVSDGAGGWEERQAAVVLTE